LIDREEYKSRSYEDLSEEFKTLYPSVLRAYELIPLMYNRLTLVDNFVHKAALDKIYYDHKHLPGFSERNIRRHLPLDNEAVPRRVRPSCPKNSSAQTSNPVRLSNAEHLSVSVQLENQQLRFVNAFLEYKVEILEAELMARIQE
jgi:hypothetical protein